MGKRVFATRALATRVFATVALAGVLTASADVGKRVFRPRAFATRAFLPAALAGVATTPSADVGKRVFRPRVFNTRAFAPVALAGVLTTAPEPETPPIRQDDRPPPPGGGVEPPAGNTTFQTCLQCCCGCAHEGMNVSVPANTWVWSVNNTPQASDLAFPGGLNLTLPYLGWGGTPSFGFACFFGTPEISIDLPGGFDASGAAVTWRIQQVTLVTGALSPGQVSDYLLTIVGGILFGDPPGQIGAIPFVGVVQINVEQCRPLEARGSVVLNGGELLVQGSPACAPNQCNGVVLIT